MVTTPRWTRTYRNDTQSLAAAKSLCSSRTKVLIAIDLEWDETDSSNLLEIGTAVLDLRPGRLHPNRFPPSTWSIRAQHIVIRENAHIHNTKYHKGNKKGFKFGRSWYLKEERALERLRELLQSKYNDGEVVLVGHFMQNDLKLLGELEIEIPESVRIFDTGSLERAWSGRVNGNRKSLEDLCEQFEVPYYQRHKLHNAGNDAFFTMAIFSEMCCESRTLLTEAQAREINNALSDVANILSQMNNLRFTEAY